MRTYEFNDIQGDRDRQCEFAIVKDGVFYTPEEAMASKLATFKRLWSNKNGKWSNSQWQVTVNSANLIVCRAPFSPWSDDLATCLNHVADSCQDYIGYYPTTEQCLLFFKNAFPEKFAKILALDKAKEELI
jgi:hypothetical protein